MSIINNPFPLLGIPFQYGGRGPKSFDCWGLVMEVFKRFLIKLPDYEVCSVYEDFNLNQYDNASEKIDSIVSKVKWNWERVDSLFTPSIMSIRFNHPTMINHVGVYLGDGKFIHTRDKVGVCLDRIDSKAWERKIEGYYIYKGGESIEE